eukprot:2099812-Lingulodinium_polyedra.AAC.1
MGFPRPPCAPWARALASQCKQPCPKLLPLLDCGSWFDSPTLVSCYRAFVSEREVHACGLLEWN